ncbi:MAG: dethiobiotin synthase [Betaproteobacteria bacterium]|nr:dethiobiotin synthase [Betaproteobacteria bacterium]
MSGFFITGTDTGVGKTFATCALIHALQRRGLAVATMKPIAAGNIDVNGVPMNEDVALLMDATGHRFPLHAVNPYCFRAAIAPHIAAKQEGVEIDMAVIQTAYSHLAERADVVLVEGAGGFLVPLSDNESMALIPAALQLPALLVVGMRLGCINHALLTVEAIRSRGLPLAGWIANSPGTPMTAFDENLTTLKRMIDAPLIGNIAHANIDSRDANQILRAARLAASHLSTEIFVPVHPKD